MKIAEEDYVYIVVGCVTIALVIAMACSGCVSAPPGARAGWSVSLVSIQLGGSQTSVDTINNLTGTNVTQRHTLGDNAVSDPINATVPLTTGVK